MHRIVHWMLTRDVQMFYYFNRQMQCKIFDWMMPCLTHLGGATVTVSSLLLLMIFNDGALLIWSAHAFVALITSHLVVRMIKKLIPRQRPYLIVSNTRTFPNPLKDYSFPSGHTTSSFAIAMTFSLFSSSLAIVLFPLAFIVGLSRIYLGLHYPTDVMIGAFIGSVTALIVFIL